MHRPGRLPRTFAKPSQDQDLPLHRDAGFPFRDRPASGHAARLDRLALFRPRVQALRGNRRAARVARAGNRPLALQSRAALLAIVPVGAAADPGAVILVIALAEAAVGRTAILEAAIETAADAGVIVGAATRVAGPAAAIMAFLGAARAMIAATVIAVGVAVAVTPAIPPIAAALMA